MKALTDRTHAVPAVVAVAGLAIGMIGGPVMAAPQDDTIQGVQGETQEQLQRARAEFDNSMESAQQLLNEANFERARQEAVLAKVRLDQRRAVIPTSEYDAMAGQVETLIATIDERAEEDRLRRQADAQREARDAENRRQAEAAQERQRLIDEGLRRVRQLQDEIKYREALQVIDEILFIDSKHAAALALRDALEANVIFEEYIGITRTKNQTYSKLDVENQAAMIAPVANVSGPGDRSMTGVVVYPEDWPQLSYTRTSGGAFQISAADRAVAERLAHVTLPRVDFDGHHLDKVLVWFRDVTDLNMYVDWNALALIGVQPTDSVQLQLHNVSAQTALARVLEQVGDDLDRPRYDINDGILAISTNDALRKRTATVVYDIRDLLFEVAYFDDAPSFSLDDHYKTESDDSGVGGNRFSKPVSPFATESASLWGDPVDSSGDQSDRQTRDIKVDEIVRIIQNTIEPESWRELGGDVGSIEELNGNLIITNTPRQLQRIEGLLTQLREISAMQINYESRFLDVSSDWFEQIGIDLDLYFNTGRSMRAQQLAQDPLSHLSDFFGSDGQLLDPLVYGSINQAIDPETAPYINALNYGGATGIPVDSDGDGFPDSITYISGAGGPPIRNTGGFTPLQFIQNSSETVSNLVELTSFGQIAAGTPAAIMGIQYLDDIQVDLLIQATQADQRSVVLTAPRLTAFNGQRAWVAVTKQIAYVSNLIPITGDGAVAFQPIPAVLNEGFVLDVEGVISADRRYVTMTVIASLAQNAQFQTQEIQGAVGSQSFGGGAQQIATEITLPQIEAALVQTTVSVPDRGTILLGGQRRVTEIEVEQGVPVLSKIPVINRFFTNRVTSKEEKTLLVLIRPEIIIQQEHEQTLFPGLLDTLGGAASYVR